MFHSLSFLHQKETWSIDVLFQSSAWPSFKMQIQFDTFENKHKIFFSVFSLYYPTAQKQNSPYSQFSYEWEVYSINSYSF